MVKEFSNAKLRNFNLMELGNKIKKLRKQPLSQGY